MRIDGMDIELARGAAERLVAALDLAVPLLVRDPATHAIRDICNALGIGIPQPGECSVCGGVLTLRCVLHGLTAR